MSLFTLPSVNQGIWLPGTNVGVPGGIFQYLNGGVNDRAVTGTLVDMVAEYGCDQDGAVEVNTQIAQAVADAIGPTVLFFKKHVVGGGVASYLVDGAAVYTGYKPDITIRGELDPMGEGLDQYLTEFLGNSGGQLFIANDPGGFGNNIQEVTGTKTKGTTTLTVADSSGYSVGRTCMVVYGNENDDARIIAGGMFNWGSGGTHTPYMQQELRIVTAVGTGTITVEPGISSDATNRRLFIATQPANNKTTGWGFEDFKVTFADPPDHSNNFISFTAGVRNWCYNLRFTNWHRMSQNGSCILWFTQYQSEIRHCWFHGSPDAQSDGAIQVGGNTSCLEEDNIISGSFGVGIYDSGNCNNNVRAFNFCPTNMVLNTHSVHPTLNLAEGNYAYYQGSDGYHGSSSDNTIYRNHYEAITLQRCKRRYVVAHNEITGFVALGNPNIGNGMACGFSGPTGLSARAGTIDFIQNCNGTQITDYEIQPSDISEGDFPNHWKVTAELVDRISDKIAQFQVSGGDWRTGLVPSGGNAIIFSIAWGDLDPDFTLDLIGAGYNFAGNGVVTDVTGDLVTVDFTLGTFYSDPANVLPAEGTICPVGPGPAGWQERDLDVEVTALFQNNTIAGVVDYAPGGTTYPDSLAYTGTPSWWANDGFAGPFPPNLALHDPTKIPAGARFYAEEPLSAPEIPGNPTTAGTYAEGSTVTATASAPVTGNPPPVRSWKWQVDDGGGFDDVPGETSITWDIPLGLYAGFQGRVAQIEDSSEAPPGGVIAYSAPFTILAFMGDIDIIDQTVNTDPVSELWVINGVPVLHEHSGNYPQLDGTGTQNTATTYTLPNVGEIAFHGGDNKQVYGWLTSQLVGASNAARLAYALSIRP